MAPKIVLYGPAQAPFTEKCRRALLLKGFEFDLREPSGPEDYRRWSPDTGLLPVMTVDDERIADSTRILLHLDDMQPDPPLLSSDPMVAAQQRNLEDWADESFLWYWQQWRRLRDSGQVRESADAARSSLARRALAWLRAGGTWERPQTGILRGLSDRMADLTGLLGARSFFYAEAVSMADLAVYGMLHTLEIDSIPGTARLLAERPMLVEFMRRVEAATGG